MITGLQEQEWKELNEYVNKLEARLAALERVEQAARELIEFERKRYSTSYKMTVLQWGQERRRGMDERIKKLAEASEVLAAKSAQAGD